MANVFIVAEVGSNWHVGPDRKHNLATATECVRVAAKCGADAVKFQAFSEGGLYLPDAGAAEYLGGDAPINAVVDERALPREWLPKLAETCREHGVEFMATAFSPEDADAVDPFVSRHKVASYELGWERLIRHVAGKEKPLILSTGAATPLEVVVACSWVGADAPLTILHCTAAYPAPEAELNLRALSTLLKDLDGAAQVGLSDHSFDPIVAPVAAVALGAVLIEKHFTLSRAQRGPDHAFALEPAEFSVMVRAVRAAEGALGTGRKEPMPCEKYLRGFAKRVVCAVAPIASRDELVEGHNVACFRPGKHAGGIPAHLLGSYVGGRARRAIPAWTPVRRGDVYFDDEGPDHP